MLVNAQLSGARIMFFASVMHNQKHRRFEHGN